MMISQNGRQVDYGMIRLITSKLYFYVLQLTKLIDGNNSKLFNFSIICMVYKLVNNVLHPGSITYLFNRLHAQSVGNQNSDIN